MTSLSLTKDNSLTQEKIKTNRSISEQNKNQNILFQGIKALKTDKSNSQLKSIDRISVVGSDVLITDGVVQPNR